MSVIKFSGKSRFKLRCDTTADWESANPVLLNGEIGIEQTADGGKKVKIGDGVTEWVKLGYLVIIDSELSDTSENPVQNRCITREFAKKQKNLGLMLSDGCIMPETQGDKLQAAASNSDGTNQVRCTINGNAAEGIVLESVNTTKGSGHVNVWGLSDPVETYTDPVSGSPVSKEHINSQAVNKGYADATFVKVYNNAGAHNSIYRGKNLGTNVTEEQYAAIGTGTFEDLYIGDYWVINGVVWRIAAFDYYYLTGDASCTTHHVTIVPDTNLYTAKMNASSTTEGGYVGSEMYTTNLETAKTIINNAFGSAHILKHRQYLINAVANGKPKSGSWYNSTVELMTEQNVYGGKVFSVSNDGSSRPALYTIDKSQFPLFAHNPPISFNRQTVWLRDVVSSIDFASATLYGYPSYNGASNSYGVRPSFSIKQ